MFHPTRLCCIGLLLLGAAEAPGQTATDTLHVIWVDDTHDDFDGTLSVMHVLALHNRIEPISGRPLRLGMWIVEPSRNGNHRCPHPDSPLYLKCPQSGPSDYTRAGARLAESVLARAGIGDVPVYRSTSTFMLSPTDYQPIVPADSVWAARELARYVALNCTPANRCFIATGHRMSTVISALALYGCSGCEFPGMQDRIVVSLLSLAYEQGAYESHGKNFLEDACAWGAAFDQYTFPIYHTPTRVNGGIGCTVLGLQLDATEEDYDFGGYGTPADDVYPLIRADLTFSDPAWDHNRWWWWQDEVFPECVPSLVAGEAWHLGDAHTLLPALYPLSMATTVTGTAPQVDPSTCGVFASPFDPIIQPNGGRPLTTFIGFDHVGMKQQYQAAMQNWQPNTKGVSVPLKVLLHGPYEASSETMTTGLNPGLLPGVQPYQNAPWDCPDPSVLPASPDPRVVDWVLVGLRRAAGPEGLVAHQAALLLDDGQVVDTALNPLFFPDVWAGLYYVTVEHRNHLGVMSAKPVSLSAQTPVYDFSVALSMAFGVHAMTEVAPGRYAMWAGDGNHDARVTASDFLTVWFPQNGNGPGYWGGDFNLSGSVTAFDFLSGWLSANGYSSQIPQ